MNNDFEWDDAKAEANFRKHGLDFETATEVFRDVFVIDELDASMDYGEQRFQIIGHAGGKLVTVIYTERGERIRIISARQATRREHDRYYHKNSQD
jgi:uncharacterized DUF497 family protein